MTQQNLRARRRRQAAQSLTVALSVLFLLLFLGGIFIAVVISNLKAAQRGAKQSGASKFADAGLTYLDKQLTESPEGADWRPRPDFADGAIDPNDPDFNWLRPCSDPSIDLAATPPEPCGFTRVNLGGEQPTVGNLGGRALVRVAYKPYRPYTGAGSQPGDLWDDRNGDGAFQNGERVCRSGEIPTGTPPSCAAPDPTRKYIRLESAGCAGVVVKGDPTTYGRSESKALVRELIGYKSIGINEYLRYFTNKDNRPATASLGSTLQVKDAPSAAITNPRPTTEPVIRDIPSLYYGAIRSNAPLLFHGPNYLFLDPRRNDALEVAGRIDLENVDGAAAAIPNTSAGNPGRVTVIDTGATGSIAPPANPNVFPSGSALFTTLGGLVRDSVSGAAAEANLRSVGRISVPTIDLGRYRALTQNSQPLSPKYTGPNPIGPALGGDFPGTIGWGAGLYIGNSSEVNPASESVAGAYSPRTDWLNPGTSAYWQAGFKYVPPGVSLTLGPRFLTLSRSVTFPASAARSYSFRKPTGERLSNATIVRYSDLPGTAAPQAGLPAPGGNEYRYAGYPADAIPGVAGAYEGELVIFAEGNLRLPGGVLGGRDPETGAYFRRHVTVVSNGTVYIEGSLLRDNIDPTDNSAGAREVRGKSTLAILAHDYVTVNTTQFLKPSDVEPNPSPTEVGARLGAAKDTLAYSFLTAPVDVFDPNTGRITNFTVPGYGSRLFLRHSSIQVGPAGGGAASVANVFLTMNQSVAGGLLQDNFLGPSYPVARPTATAGAPLDDVFGLAPAILFPANVVPYANPSTLGMDNRGKIIYDKAGSSGNYLVSRVGIAPLDIRVEALIYAQEGSFFVIPGPWFNPNPNDTYEAYLQRTLAADATFGARDGDNPVIDPVNDPGNIDPHFPFYGEPQDIRMTFVGAISENLPAEVGDQGAWLEKWGWAPSYQGSTGLPRMTGFADQKPAEAAVHGSIGGLPGPLSNLTATNTSSAIVYIYDDRLGQPYDTLGVALRTDAYGRVLPATPRLPIAPGMLYSGESPQ